MRKLILICGAALAITACQPNPAVNNNSDVIVNNNVEAPVTSDCGVASNTLADEKALFVAETAYNVAADAYVKLASTLPTDKRASARKLLIQAYDALKLARAAYKAGDGCSLNSYVELVKTLGAQAQAILPKQ